MDEDLVAFGIGLGMIGFAFLPIFLILGAIKWNEKKNLFLDSWFVYLGWIISGIIGFLTYEYITSNFPTDGKTIFTTPVILVIIFQTCSLTTILYNRCRPKKEFSLRSGNKKSVPTTSLWEACRAAFLVSIITSLMMWGLITVLQSMNKKPNSPYGLYD